MKDSSRPRSIDLSPFEATLDAAGSLPTPGSSSYGSSSYGPTGPRVAMVEGSGPELSSDTYNVLRVRLRAAAFALCIGSFAFLIWGMISPPPPKEASSVLWFCHVAHVVALAVIGASLYVRCPCSVSKLRVAEFLIFGAPFRSPRLSNQCPILLPRSSAAKS